MSRPTAVPAVLAATILAGCRSETVRQGPAPPRLLEFPTGVLPTGAYHGVTLFFEVDLRTDGAGRRLESDALPGVAEWIDADRASGGTYHRQLPPLTPVSRRDGTEVYRIGELPVVEYRNTMFEVGRYRYLAQPKGRLYVFQPRRDFSFRFRGHEVVVPSKEVWTPSLYYYPEEEVREGRRRRLVREVVQVGLATIEALAEEGRWVVNGKAYYPSGGRPLSLVGAIHAQTVP